MSAVESLFRHDASFSLFNIVAPQDGGWSLIPMENLLRGMRNARDVTSLEIFGRDGVVGYGVRTNNGGAFSGQFHSYFPQAHLTGESRSTGQGAKEDDWLYLDEDEFALVQTLSLEYESFLPLQIFEDRTLEQALMDPLAGVIGVLSSSSKVIGAGSGSDRCGVRTVIRPASANWGEVWQKRMQKRRDGEDRVGGRPGAESSGPSVGLVLGVTAGAGVLLGNWYLWSSGNLPGLIGLDAAVVVAGGLSVAAWRRISGRNQRRPYMDELLVEGKLKSLSFCVEVQLIRIFRGLADEAVARNDMEKLVYCLRSFDDPAGNAWHEGRLRQYSGQRVFQGAGAHPFQGGSQELDWIDRSRASSSILSAREVASLWHLPLGSSEMASMERTASGSLSPYLGDLRDAGEDAGPLVGLDSDGNALRLPESSIKKHMIIIGKSGVGKSTLVKHIVAHKMKRKAEGKDNDAIVVIDPHADLVRDLLQMVPPEVVDKVRLLDFGREDRVPGLNLVDPRLFPDRDRCVDTIVTTLKYLWEHWGNRLEDLLKNGLLIIYEFNAHADTARDEMLTMLDILRLLEDGAIVGQGRDRKKEASAEQLRILSRVRDPRLKQWFNSFLAWPPDVQAEAVGPVRSRIGAYASHQRASVIMGQRESTIMLSDVLADGLILLVSTAQGTIGVQPAALMGGTMVSLVESALRDQEKVPPDQRAKCLLVCDEFQTITGANWEGLLAEIRKYGCSLMLATQSLARLNTPERRLKEGVLGNVGVIVGYQMSADDARIIAPEMDSSRVEERFLVNSFPHHCYMRINSDKKCYPAFSMATLPPPSNAEGAEAAEAAVLEASVSYTTDWRAALERMNAEVDRQILEGSKLPVMLGEKNTSSPYDDANSKVARGGGRRERKRAAAESEPDGDATAPVAVPAEVVPRVVAPVAPGDSESNLFLRPMVKPAAETGPVGEPPALEPVAALPMVKPVAALPMVSRLWSLLLRCRW